MAAGPVDAVVVGSGPNGLAAAITLARAGRSVLVREAQSTIGGGMRTLELTLPGFRHDLCATVHPLAAGSPFMRALPLAGRGAELAHSAACLAHPLDDGSAVLLRRSPEETAAGLGEDGDAYRRLFAPLAARWGDLAGEILRPFRIPRRPLLMASFGWSALRSARGLARARFRGEPARALLAGLAAHSCLPLENAASASFALVLGAAAHAVGWPVVRGGSVRLAGALRAHLESLGGAVAVDAPVRALDELRGASAVLCDVTPRQLLALAPDLPEGYRRRLARFRYGPGVFKMDWALDAPVPWKAADCALAATVHLGGTLEEIAASERAAWTGSVSERPFVILVQPTLVDPSRAPEGKHTLWAYCHVPNGSEQDMTARIEAQIERFAPGFRDRILARAAHGPAALARHNENLVGGDINGGAANLLQLVARPTWRAPYTTPRRNLYLCSASTPPGGGVHGMCGHLAARTALHRTFGVPDPGSS